MKPIYSNQVHHWENKPSIFLAGPTPRRLDVASWRPEALALLEPFNGLVLVPEPTDLSEGFEFMPQVEWEFEGLTLCSCVLFWIPREFPDMSAFTTNVEFGSMVGNPACVDKVVYGRPENSKGNRYLDWFFTKHSGRSCFATLEETVAAAMSRAAAIHSTRSNHAENSTPT